MPNVTSGWTPVTIGELTRIMDGAPFFWCLAGGHAIERMVGHPYREHDDLDIVVLRSQQTAVQEWFRDWMLAAADPPGALRPWIAGEKLTWRVHDIWARRPDASGWELQLMILEDDATSWFFRRDDRVHGKIDDLRIDVGGVPCLRPDLQLLFKAKSSRLKDDMDFLQLLPVLSDSHRQTLWDWLDLTSPNGHPWMPALEHQASS